MAENETKKKVIFAVGNKRIIFSDSAFPTFAEGKQNKKPFFCTMFFINNMIF